MYFILNRRQTRQKKVGRGGEENSNGPEHNERCTFH